MTRDQHLAFCNKCKNRKFDLKKGLICSLTDEKADFEESCPDYEHDPQVEAKVVRTVQSLKSISVGKVFSLAFDIYLKNFFQFTILSALTYLPIFLYISGQSIEADDYLEPDWVFSITGLELLFGSILVSALMLGSFQTLRGKKAQFGHTLKVTVKSLIPVFIASIILIASILFAYLSILNEVYLGYLLFIVLGIAVVIRGFMIIPVVVIEGKNPFSAFQRSVELSEGNRWNIFGIILIFGVLMRIIDLLIESSFPLESYAQENTFASMAAYVLLEPIRATAITVTYYRIRSAKEGLDVEEIASVFD